MEPKRVIVILTVITFFLLSSLGLLAVLTGLGFGGGGGARTGTLMSLSYLLGFEEEGINNNNNYTLIHTPHRKLLPHSGNFLLSFL